MVDIHSHIIFGVDDGPSTIVQSLNMVREAERLGINRLVASPHYHPEVFNLEHLEENYQELLYRAREYNVALYRGYEVFINPENLAFINNPENLAFINSKEKLGIYKTGIIILDFPFNVRPLRCLEILTKYKLKELNPVISHIERNRVFLNKSDYVAAFKKAGCFIQLDAASIIGVYGLKVKEFSKKLLQLNLVDVVASNAHCVEDYTKWYLQAYKNVSNWVGKQEADALFKNNGKGILEIQLKENLVYKNIM